MKVPTAQQIAFFSAVEDIQELTAALVVLVADADGEAVAVAGDDAIIPPELRAVLGGKKLAEAGSVRALLEPVDLGGSPLNVAIHAVGTTHLLAIVFDAEADFSTVETVGKEAREMLAEILAGAALPN